MATGATATATSSVDSAGSSHRRINSSTSTITPGLLVVNIHRAKDLSLPKPYDYRPSGASQLSGGSGAGFFSSPYQPGHRTSNSVTPLSGNNSNTNRRYSANVRPPVYLVVEYDKTQVILDASAGSLDAPVWETSSDFDVSRVEPLSIQVFARVPISSSSTQLGGANSFAGGGGPFSTSSGSYPNRSLRRPESPNSVNNPVTNSSGSVHPSAGGAQHHQDRRVQASPAGCSSTASTRPNMHKHSASSISMVRFEDVFLGSAKIDIAANSQKCFDGWLPLSGGSGSIDIRVSFNRAKLDKHLTIDDFDLLKVVGKGSFGKVMQVRKRDTKRIYALKTLRKAHIISRAEVNHTLAERTVLAQIDNPFIVPLKFSFQSPEKLYLVLAFVNGGELFHHLQHEGRFDLNRARFYTAELLCALECLHEYNVIYRDLKPENILLDYTGHIALCDFGLCKLNMEGQEKTNTFCGTPEYLAPELLLAQGYTKVVDWWTLGVLFYEMLTGLPPFYDTDVNVMYNKILSEPLRFPDDMDRDAKSLLQGLLCRDPKKRLGVNGAAEIRAHPFFAQIDWRRLMNKKYAAPFKPSVQSATDTSNFDVEFTSEVPADSVADNSYLSESVQQQFGGWTYTNQDSRLERD